MASTLTNEEQKNTASPRQNLAGLSLVVLLGLVAGLQILFRALPWAWFEIAGFPKSATSNISLAVLGIILLFGGLFYLGKSKLFTSNHGVKGGVFVALLLFLLNLFVDSWWGKVVEGWVYDSNIMPESAGMGFTAAGAGLVAVGSILFFFRPANRNLFTKIEDQGWFSWETFKQSQGSKVRRGTIVGLLLLFGSGIYSISRNDTFAKGSADWNVDLPFTGKILIEADKVGDTLPILESQGFSLAKPTVSRSVFKAANKQVDPATHVKIGTLTGDSKFKSGEVVTKEAFQDEVRELTKLDRRPAETTVPKIAEGKLSYETVLLLPAIQFTGPVILLFSSIWLAWRMVNLPVFADFLISTEAEMVKVSWSSKKKLIQDTIVVLTTLVLMSVFLFVTDQFWRIFLSQTGVLRFGQENAQKNTSVDLKKW